ncbi:MAG: OstA-like protein [Paludibacter sp.]|nr:OstA-like protein [Paludibacter sp.]
MNMIFNTRHIVLFGVLCLFIATIQAQQGHIKPKELRKQVLESQNPTPKKENLKKKKGSNRPVNPYSRKPKPMVPPKPLAPIVNPLNNPKATIIYLENAETWSADKDFNPDIQVLKGNVRFRHDNALLYCDSAYFYQKANSLDAFSNVKIVQGDTLFVYGDYLYYDGNTKLARMRHNVRMENRKTTLTTDSLNYDRNINIAYYFTGGKIVDPENTLTSVWGQYSPSTDDAIFRTKVKLTNNNFILTSDTLKYNTKNHVANIVGPSHIDYKDETNIYSKKGWYNTENEKMMLLNRSLIVHKDGKTLAGDTVFYDKVKKYGEAFVNVELTDTINKSTLYGDYLYYDENNDEGLATDSALLVDWSSKDTLWVHSDTIRTYKDSVYNVAKGYFNVRIFRNDVQGIADSLVYSARDSIIKMYGEPVLWAEENQLSGDFIQTHTKDKKIEQINIQKNAIAIQKEDSIHFNQLSGKEIIAYLDSGQLYRVFVNGNAETIYYPRDDADSTLIGLNKTESSYVNMYLKNKQIERVVMTASTTGIMYPLLELSGGDLYLKNFFWLDEQRPTKSSDVMLTIPKKAREKIGTSSIMGKTPDSSGSGGTKTPPAKGQTKMQNK